MSKAAEVKAKIIYFAAMLSCTQVSLWARWQIGGLCVSTRKSVSGFPFPISKLATTAWTLPPPCILRPSCTLFVLLTCWSWHCKMFYRCTVCRFLWHFWNKSESLLPLSQIICHIECAILQKQYYLTIAFLCRAAYNKGYWYLVSLQICNGNY